MPTTWSADPIIHTLTVARISRGLTQSHTAQIAGIHRNSILYYELARHQPTLLALHRWAAALGYTLTLVPTPCPTNPSTNLPSPQPMSTPHSSQEPTCNTLLIRRP